MLNQILCSRCINIIKSKLFHILSFFSLLALSGCGVIAYIAYGVKPAKNESHMQQIEYLVSEGIDTFNVYSVEKSHMVLLSDERFAINTYKLKTGTGASAVQIRMYDRDGVFITGWSQCMGSNPRVLGMLDSLPMYSPSFLPINYNLSLYSDLELFDMDDLEKANLIEQSEKVDYTIIIFWAEWVGRFTDNAFADVHYYVSKYPEVDFLILKLNTATLAAIE